MIKQVFAFLGTYIYRRKEFDQLKKTLREVCEREENMDLEVHSSDSQKLHEKIYYEYCYEKTKFMTYCEVKGCLKNLRGDDEKIKEPEEHTVEFNYNSIFSFLEKW